MFLVEMDVVSIPDCQWIDCIISFLLVFVVEYFHNREEEEKRKRKKTSKNKFWRRDRDDGRAG